MPPASTARFVGRRALLVALLGIATGCVGEDGDGDAADPPEDEDVQEGAGSGAAGNPALGEVEQRGDLVLASPAFEDGERIPDRFGYDAENVNPPLAIGRVPSDASALALVMDDPDAVEPAGEVWEHWLVWNVPPSIDEIPEDWTPETAEEGRNDFGEVGYGGPGPPEGEHRYRFKLFALAERLTLPTETDAAEMGRAMRGHVLASTQLDGTYPA